MLKPEPGSARQAVRAIRAAEAARAQRVPCTLEGYRGAVQALPHPTELEIEAFVSCISEVHSWYKHIPPLPPGAVLYFFLEPLAGLEQVSDPAGVMESGGGGTVRHPVPADGMSTAVRLARCGHLSFGTKPGAMIMPEGGADSHESEHLIINTPRGARCIPAVVALAGSTAVTGLIHPESAHFSWWWFWDRHLEDLWHRRWPEETGGEETLSSIRNLLDVLRHSPRQPDGMRASVELDRVSRELESLIRPERIRLRTNMAGAIRNMLAVSFCE